MAKPKRATKRVVPKKSKQRIVKHVPGNRLQQVLDTRYFRFIYLGFASLVLLASTTLWSLLSAKLQLSNADQLVDPLLFKSSTVLHGATFPGAHSFLFKWPLFWLVSLSGGTSGPLIVCTLGVTLATVAALAFMLYRIEHRPLVLGTLYLALASVLLLVPAMPSAGALLPVNMAMLATRNLEYVLYVAGLWLLVRSVKFRDWSFWLGVLLLGLLIASDKLFLYLALGGALTALVVYALVNHWKFTSVSVRWLLGIVVAAIVGFGLLGAIQASGIAHISQSNGSGPYGVSLTPKGVGLGILYGVAGLFTNFGANPAYDATVVSRIPHQLISRLFSVSGPSFILNMILLIAAGYAIWQLLYANLLPPKTPKKHLELPVATKLTAMLIWSTIAAGLIFVATDHYYAVDARYLTIALFTACLAAAVYARQRTWRPEQLVIAGAVLTAGILLAIPAVTNAYYDSRNALSGDNNRDSLVAQALSGHPVTNLVGDYWRVVPTALDTKNKQQVIPLTSCTQVQGTLSSSAWQVDWQKHSFAYLLSLDTGPSGYPGCTLNQVTTAYGHPNASQLIAGSYTHPKELLLFYDHGVHHAPPKAASSVATTVVPITLDQLTGTTCSSPSVMNIVAHEDDDLLFMNPDLAHDVQAGNCVRTIYVTAGDAGNNKFYWLNREAGSEAAYDEMDGPDKDIWLQRIVSISPHEFITVASPRGNPKISLIFMHLPDGNIHGDGFAGSGYESLGKLENDAIGAIKSVDQQSFYSANDLTTALVKIMHTFSPSAVRTQSPQNMSEQYPDHSDHLAVGRFAQRAYRQYEQEQYANEVTIPISYYIGYPIHAHDSNVTGDDLQQKTAAFLAYAKYDGNVCGSVEQCQHTPTYGSYLARQYQLNAK